MRAVILAGGKGTRLKPYTTLIPKPLLPIGDEMPILELVLRQLKSHGFKHVTISVSHLAHLIMSFFDHLDLGIKIDYSLEETSNPLSTIAPLTLIDDLPDNFLVMNGDIITDLHFGKFLSHHITTGQEVSVSTYKRDTKIDFGVIDRNEAGEIVGFREKPTYHFEVSMGVYGIRKNVVTALKKGSKYGFDDLMLDGLRENKRYHSVPFNGLWMDLGRGEDYDYCNEHYPEIKAKLGI